MSCDYLEASKRIFDTDTTFHNACFIPHSEFRLPTSSKLEASRGVAKVFQLKRVAGANDATFRVMQLELLTRTLKMCVTKHHKRDFL